MATFYGGLAFSFSHWKPDREQPTKMPSNSVNDGSSNPAMVNPENDINTLPNGGDDAVLTNGETQLDERRENDSSSDPYILVADCGRSGRGGCGNTVQLTPPNPHGETPYGVELDNCTPETGLSCQLTL
jgi:hypothetical protein